MPHKAGQNKEKQKKSRYKKVPLNKKHLAVIAAVILSTAQCELAKAQSVEYFANPQYINKLFPYPEAIPANYNIHSTPLGKGKRIKPCGSEVWGSTPGQETKKYHVDAQFLYNVHLIPGTSIKSSREFNKRPGVATGNEKLCKQDNKMSPNRFLGELTCSTSRIARYVMMSDVFHDKCGNIFSGYWESAYFLDYMNPKQPTMTSLAEHTGTTSKGRADNLYPDDKGQTMIFDEGGTHAEKISDFLFFTEITEAGTPEDWKQMKAVINSAAGERGAYRICPDQGFTPKKHKCPEQGRR